ncbi:right-handed parallel beta-helix repeat-containing protein [Alteromonas sp. ASW11-19]|uniref:Right-handed parallel beta-helix repeat-containing protein n=1 Tax=Alteromonas salexigens TaxID=2982530 RepID=A0ABT2VV62_9ALTE|nr:right-handed parallel beta-helix repeat-containing protein [Alteromonas salexigens]MCU7556106.1 right-handed parallel beta-helix repeat-containing protein [Alteromonas salexigens]
MMRKIIWQALLVTALVCGTPALAQKANAGQKQFAQQPGMQVLDGLEKQRTPNHQQILAHIQKLARSHTFKHLFAPLPDNRRDTAATVLLNMHNGQSLVRAVGSVAKQDSKQTKWAVLAAFALFPLDRYALLRELQGDDRYDQAALRRYANVAGMTVSEASDVPDIVSSTPLIESVALTVHGQAPDTVANVKYRAQDEQEWRQARALEWEPVQQVLTGPIVHLQPNTRYHIQIELQNSGAETAELSHTVTTRPDTPPVDPDNIHRLSDFYQGGTLDIEALGIQGKPGAWAKIVGDPDTPITVSQEDRYAINIGDNSYIYFENVTTRGARVHGVYAENAHHIWFNGCDIADWGRQPNIMKNGRAYELEDAQPINYDSALYFKQSGVITVENCYVHQPTPSANTWEHGHPKGANAFLAYGNHPDPEYKGQIILRNNRFVGEPGHRFNDIIEGRKNGAALGGFVRHSAIYNNTLAYANDDALEIDGGQHNVLVYNNDISHTYTGISAIPARVGPSFIFNNYIHDLGDENGKQWAAIKLGGLVAGPMGKVNLFHNFITVARNGITASRFKDDDTFWVNAQNNIVITEKDSNMVGYNVYDPQAYPGSEFSHNLFYNLALGEAKVTDNISQDKGGSITVDQQRAMQLAEQSERAWLPANALHYIQGFTQVSADGETLLYGLKPAQPR